MHTWLKVSWCFRFYHCIDSVVALRYLVGTEVKSSLWYCDNRESSMDEREHMQIGKKLTWRKHDNTSAVIKSVYTDSHLEQTGEGKVGIALKFDSTLFHTYCLKWFLQYKHALWTHTLALAKRTFKMRILILTSQKRKATLVQPQWMRAGVTQGGRGG